MPVCFHMERGDYGQDCASFALIKDATYNGCASHNKDIIKVHTDYDTFLADGINGSYSGKKKSTL